jgi:hypothetical protein
MKKFTGPEIYDLVLNIIILGFLIAIIILLIKCQKTKRENFATESNDWKNERFRRRANFTNPSTGQHPNIPTAPIQLYN